MTLSIFCPNKHLILNAPRCSKCGWERPQPSDIGEPSWGPVTLGAGLGGLGRHVFAQPGLGGGVAVFPWRVKEEKRPGKLIGLEAATGELRWKTELGPGERTSALLPDGKRLLAGISDVRSLGESEAGRLIAIEPSSGEITTLWKADGHQVSPPTLTGEHLILRTSSSALVAFSREKEPRELWRQPLNAWWAQPPFMAENTVLASDGHPMHGEGFLQAYRLTDGAPRWKISTDNLLSQPPTSLGQLLVIRNGRRQLLGINLKDGREVWKKEYKRIYSPPVAGKEYIFVSVRGSAPAGQEGRYVLQALNPENGEVVWEIPLPARVRIMGWGQNTLYGGSDDGHVLAYSPNGKLLWTYILGSDEDPVRTELTPTGEVLLAGTYFGKAVALRTVAPKPEIDSPESYLEREEYDSAAAAYALVKDFRRAADIYTNQLKAYDKAFALYEHAALFQEAGELASSLDLRKKASEYFQKAGNKRAYAEELIQNDDLLGAAQIYKQIGDLMRAASLYEKAGDLRSSMEVYKRLNRWGKVLKLRTKVSPDTKDIQDFEQAGKLKEAGETAFKLGMYGKAAKLFKKAEEDEYELMALEKLAKEKGEDWGLERMVELAKGMGKFGQEARVWEKLGRPMKTAEAYHRAARQAEQISQDNEKQIANLYSKAEYYFEEAGQIDLCTQCHQKVIRYTHLPVVIVEGQPQKAFREGEWNIITLNAKNIGYGIAKNIRIAVGGAQFVADSSNSVWVIRSLGKGVSTKTEFHIQHRKGEATGHVPLRIRWTWTDNKKQKHDQDISATVYVKDRDDSRTNQTPAQIIYNITGDHIGGDRFDGDKVEEGGRKGDSVDINRGKGVSLHTGVAKNSNVCPNCYLPIKEEGKHCQECGFVLEEN